MKLNCYSQLLNSCLSFVIVFALIFALFSLPGCYSDTDSTAEALANADDDDLPAIAGVEAPIKLPTMSDVSFRDGYPCDEGTWIGQMYLQRLFGGRPGFEGTSLAIGPDDTRYVAAAKGSILYLYTQAPGQEDWDRETIHYFGDQPSIQTDDQGRLHLSFYDEYYKDLIYGLYESGAWTFEIVDSAGDVGQNSAIALDNNGFTHIAYYYADDKDPKYATNKSGGWTTETIVSEGSWGVNIDMVIDQDGFAHVFYDRLFDYGGGLSYSTNKTGSWVWEGIDANGGSPAVALDSEGFLHLFYTNMIFDWLTGMSYGGLYYGINANGTWTFASIVSGVVEGVEKDIVIDQQDIIHLVYNWGRTYYANNRTGTFSAEQVTKIPNDGRRLDLAIDGQNKAWISLQDDDIYLQAMTKIDDEWVIQQLDYNNFGRSTRIALGPKDQMILAYALPIEKQDDDDDDPGNTLILAKPSPYKACWDEKVVDVGLRSSTNINALYDPNGHLHLSYSTKEELRYATNMSGIWTIETVVKHDYGYNAKMAIDHNGVVYLIFDNDDGIFIADNSKGIWRVKSILGFEPYFSANIAIDSSGSLHLCFSPKDISGFFYATNQTGGWVFEIIEPGKEIYYCNIQIDNHDLVHFCYHDRDANIIRYGNNITGSWIFEDVISHADHNASFFIDIDGHAHLFYEKSYINNMSGSWVTSEFLPYPLSSFAFDNNGIIHGVLIYIDTTYINFPVGYTGEL